MIRKCSQSDLATFAKQVKPNRRARGGKATAKATTAAKPAKRRNTAKPRAKGAKYSGLTAAAMVLATNPGKELRAKEIIEQAAERGWWRSRAATPHATIYAAMVREITDKGDKSRFKRGEAKGAFASNLTAAQRRELLGSQNDD